ncbi:MAG TPA: guanylate kinase [Gammaproteobacteria bacterium]|nr:guanylate kinase [Gammaproteobacteria bacterium]
MSRLFIIAAPSGGGKTSLTRALVENMDNLLISVSHTTRAMRPGEKDGVNYHFISDEKFQALVKQNIFLEHAHVFGSWYGTSRDWVLSQLQHNKDVILEIDWQGAKQIRELFKEAISIFILPPSMEVLHKRLELRGQDSPSIIEKRMQAAKEECSHAPEFDYVITNDDFDTAVNDLKNIILKYR